jgi:hypothetical protein
MGLDDIALLAFDVLGKGLVAIDDIEFTE